MDSSDKIVHKQTFTGGLNTVIAPKYLPSDQYVYNINCDILTSDDGNQGVITKPKGNVSVFVDLPIGRNKTIGRCLDEENNMLYFAVWNSNGYHTWYQFNHISLTTKIVIQCIRDTGGEVIFRWHENSVILSANIVKGNLLYWTCKGDEARKINIAKSMDKSTSGYGEIITESFTRAYKKRPDYAPDVNYITNSDIRINNLYGYQFKFATNFEYDDNEKSVFSDFSTVPVPVYDDGVDSSVVPYQNNLLRLSVYTGDSTVKKIRIAMKKTNIEGGESDWLIIAVLDKDTLNIPDNAVHVYDFYNNESYLSISQVEVLKPQSFLPRMPEVQEFTGKAMIYGVFPIGRPIFNVDFDINVSYSDIFIEVEDEDQQNSPYINAYNVDVWVRNPITGNKRRTSLGLVTIGQDVMKGNVFRLRMWAGGNRDYTWTYTANANDTARTVAAWFHSQVGNLSEVKDFGRIEPVVPGGSGSYDFRFYYEAFAGNNNYLQYQHSATPVKYRTLTNTGNPVINDKMGGSYRYALSYEDEDGRNSLAITNGQIINIQNISQARGIKKVTTNISINSIPPSWARKLVVQRTKNLKQFKFIHFLVNRIFTHTETSLGETYHDISLGSLYTYQQVNENINLRYDFQKGDRLRLLKYITSTGETIPLDTAVIDYEVIGHYTDVVSEQNANVTTKGTINVDTPSPDALNIGNNIVIDGNEREIVGVDSNGYILDFPIGSSTAQTYNGFEIINKRGVVRIKMNDAYPININLTDGTYPVVEVYRPYQVNVEPESENYYSIGYKFDIVDGLHTGNIQDQTALQPAIIKVEGFDTYVKNRGLITNNSSKNPNVYVSLVEDESYSDFFVSNLSSYGRPNQLDDSKGEVFFGDRLVWSSNYIEDTKINGLNQFESLDRSDFTDKYGSISLIMFNEGRLYIFKKLKTGWVPINGRLLQDQSGQEFVAISDRLLPQDMQYFLWEGGVGENPESIVRDGNDVFGVSPNSGVIFRIGGNGVIPISKTFLIDNMARDIIATSTLSNAKMFGGFNRKKDQYVINIPAVKKIAYYDTISDSNWSAVVTEYTEPISISVYPSHGTIQIDGDDILYTPDVGYLGEDEFVLTPLVGPSKTITVIVSDSNPNDDPYTVISGQSILIPIVDSYEDTGWFINNGTARHLRFQGTIQNTIFEVQPDKSYLLGISVSELPLGGQIVVSIGGDTRIVDSNGYSELTFNTENTDVISIYSDVSVSVNDIILYEGEIDSNTLVFNQQHNQFVGYASYSGDMITKFLDEFISFNAGVLWIHDKNENRNTFYGNVYPSIISFYANVNPDYDKDIYSIMLEGNKPWRVDIETPGTELRPRGQRSRLKPMNLEYYKNNFVGDFMRDMNDTRFDTEQEALQNGAFLQAKIAKITLTHNGTGEAELGSAEVYMSIK